MICSKCDDEENPITDRRTDRQQDLSISVYLTPDIHHAMREAAKKVIFS